MHTARSQPSTPSRRGRPLRREDPDAIWFVTTRTMDEVFWLHPLLCSPLQPANRQARRVVDAKRHRLDTRLRRLVASANRRRPPHQPQVTLEDAKAMARDLISSALARAQAHCAQDGTPPVEVFAVMVMSNHVHLVLRAPGRNLSKFVGYFLARVAQGLNLLLGRTGAVFSRRFDAQPALDDDAAARRVAYTLHNPVAAGLVRCPKEWPGFVAVAGWSDDQVWIASYFDRTAWQLAKRPEDRRPFWKTATLELSKLPSHADVPEAQYLRSVLQWAQGELAQPDRVLGLDKVLDTDFHARPKRVKRSPRPYAFGSEEDLRRHRESMQASIGHYEHCRELQRAGAPAIRWPAGMYAPGSAVAA